MDTYIIIAVCCVAVGIIIAALRSPGFLKKFAGSAVAGVVSLIAVNLTGTFTGCALAISFVNIAVSVFLGIPGVISLILIKTIFAF